MKANRGPQVLGTIQAVIVVCLVSFPMRANGAGGGTTRPVTQTSRYVFLPDQSKLVQTGGIAGVHRTYVIRGQFQLTVDPNAGAAIFSDVDANAADDSPFVHVLDPNEVFNMAGLGGTVLDDGSIRFKGKAKDLSSVLINLTFTDGRVGLLGQTTPPPGSADFFVFSMDAVAQRKYGGGTGTAEDPYQIATAADLILLGESIEDYDRHFILTADIDLDPNLPGRRVFDKAVIAPDTDPTKDWFQGTAFGGSVDGNGHTISHLTAQGAECLGLFGGLGYQAEIRDLGVVDINIVASGKGVGGLVGSNWGTVTECYCTGVVSGSSDVGGLVGYNAGGVDCCYSTTLTIAESCVGGLVGTDWSGPSRCYSVGSVRGNSDVGGLVGKGYSRNSLADCFWDTQTSGQSQSAGGTGKTTIEMKAASTFLDAGWDFVGEIANGTWQIWQMPEAGGYPVLAAFNGHTPPQLRGRGTPGDPYLISSALELGAMVHYNRYAHYRLAASIDLSGTRWHSAAIPRFAGTLDGNGHTISNLKGRAGLFGQLESGAEVRDLGIVDVNITSSGGYVGGMVGENRSLLIRCYSTGVVNGDYSVGGLVGENAGAVVQCYSAAVVSGNGRVGGLVGSGHLYGSVSQCCSTGAVTGGSVIGGLIGDNNQGSVTCCYSTGSVKGDQYVGGLLGFSGGVVTGCYSIGAVSGRSVVGGLVGGLISDTSWVIDVTTCFWDVQMSGQAKSAWGAGKTTAQMEDMQVYLDAGWDFEDEIADGTSQIWRMPREGGYPVLAALNGYVLPRLRGSGTAKDPYLISDALDLGAMVHYSPYAHYRLASWIDLSGIHWGTAVIPWFAGTFDGSGHTISHLSIRGGSYVGLFGWLESGAEVRNLGVVDANVTGSGDEVGGLVGANGGTLSQCYSMGEARGDHNIGGLAGWNYGIVTQCHSACEATGSWDIGGLVGYNSRNVTQCYSTGVAAGIDSYVGGLAGANGGTLTECYSTGLVRAGAGGGGLVGWLGLMFRGKAVGIEANCFWNIETSRQTKSCGGTGKTTAEMQTARTFLSAGWDFVGETVNGTKDIWWINEGKDYPRLWWETPAE